MTMVDEPKKITERGTTLTSLTFAGRRKEYNYLREGTALRIDRMTYLLTAYSYPFF